MTTEMLVRRAADLSVNNEVLNWGLGGPAAGQRLAGAAWLSVGDSPKEAHGRALTHASSLVLARLTGYVMWLLAGHTAWQTDSRIARHRGLWGSLKARNVVVPLGRSTEEHFVESAGRIRCFGGIQLGQGSFEPVVAILEAEPISHLVALKIEDDAVAERLVRSGWERAGFGPSADVLSVVSDVDGIVFCPVGEFDDRDSGCVALGKLEILDELLR